MKIRAIAALLFILISVSAFGEGRIKITGYVRDADGNPLELVNVRVKNTLIGSMTNEKGYYSFSISPGDSISIIYSCLGYNKAERIIPSAQADMRLNVQMNYTSFDLGEVSVTAIRKQTTTMESLNADKIKLLPDPSGGSIESLVVTFAGVSSNNELSSQYSVRGGSYDENIVYVNGIEVFRPLLIRSGQQEGLSFINPDLTEAVNFAAGGFEARYGDKMSSVLDITYKRPKIFEGSASASLLGANAYVGSSIGKFTQVTGFRFKAVGLFWVPWIQTQNTTLNLSICKLTSRTNWPLNGKSISWETSLTIIINSPLIAGKPLSVQPSIPRTSKSISTEGKETVSKPYSVRLH